MSITELAIFQIQSTYTEYFICFLPSTAVMTTTLGELLMAWHIHVYTLAYIVVSGNTFGMNIFFVSAETLISSLDIQLFLENSSMYSFVLNRVLGGSVHETITPSLILDAVTCCGGKGSEMVIIIHFVITVLSSIYTHRKLTRESVEKERYVFSKCIKVKCYLYMLYSCDFLY